MARTRKALPARVDVAHLISAGVLASVCPRSLIDEVLADTGKASQRERLLPAPAVVHDVMALALWREAPLEEVLRVVCEGLQWLGGGEAGAVQASKSAISQARTRLGSQVMRQLAERVLRPLAALAAPGAWYRGLRVMGLDGSCMDVADASANAEFFGYPGASRGQSAFPQARLLGLVECGTHVVTAAEVAPYGRSEQAMAAQMLRAKLKPGMLVLADRNFRRLQALATRLRQRRQAGSAGQGQPQVAGGATAARWLVPRHRLRQRRPPSRCRTGRARHRLHARGLGHAATGQLPAGDQHPRPG
jgi:hypothetical protein